MPDRIGGFGVVFSDRAFDFLRAHDEAMYRLLSPHMETWPSLTIVHNDMRTPITGNGFAAIERLELRSLLYAHVEKLGMRIEFDTAIESLADRERLAGADLIVAANGAFSFLRQEYARRFGAACDWRPNKFIWYGISRVFDSLSLTFRETEHGTFCAHHYRYSPTMSTFLVEAYERLHPEASAA